MDVRYALPLQQLPYLRVLRHARPLDGRKHQGLDADVAILPPQGADQGRHHPVGCRVVGLAGVPLDGGNRGKAHEKPQVGLLDSLEEIPRPEEFAVQDHGEIIRDHLAEETVPEDSGAVDDPADLAITIRHLR